MRGHYVGRQLSEMKEQFNIEWVFHEDESVDIAIIPFGYDPDDDDVVFIPEDEFLGIEELVELYQVFFLSYQPGVPIEEKISPVMRKGMISLINDDKTFYIDGSAFPGNSGSPVFFKPFQFILSEEGGSTISHDLGMKFLGIIGEYITYEETAVSTQTGRSRITFEEHTGLTKVWSVSYIMEIMESEQFKEQLEEQLNQEGD